MKTVCVLFFLVASSLASPWRQQTENRFPNRQPDYGSRGTWDVKASRDQRGPQIRLEGEGNIYKNGQFSIDGRGHHEFGKGRKPETEVFIEGKYRFRRDIQSEDNINLEDEVQENVESTRVRRSPFREGERQFPGQNQEKKGSWDVSATRDHRGPQIKAQGEGNVYSKGNSRVDVGGQWEAGRGRKPSYGVSVKGRWRRDLAEIENEDDVADNLHAEIINEESSRVRRSPFREGERQFPGQNQEKKGSWDVSATRDHRGPQIKAQGEGNVYSKGNSRVDVGGQWEAGRGRKPSYGVSVKGRWRRDLAEVESEDDFADEVEPVEEFSRVRRSPFREGERQFPGQNQNQRGGSWDVSATRDQRGPQIKVQGEGNVYSKGNSRVDVGGQWEAGRGRKPSYGVTVNGRWRRDLEEIENEELQNEEHRVRVARQTKEPRTTVTVTGQHTPGSRPTANVDVNHLLWQSRDQKSNINLNGNALFGQGKPQYSGGATFTNGRTTVGAFGQKTPGSRPTANIDVNNLIWQSRDHKSNFSFNGNAQYGQGKPQYYGGINFTRRF